MNDLDSPNYGDCDGFRIPGGFSPDAFRSAINYKPKPEDLFIATYPKCGTLWMQHIVLLILRKGKPFEHVRELLQNCPFLEMAGADALNNINGPGAIKIHLPFHLAPFSSQAKYIYVARDPKDCCVSFYHHTKMFATYNFRNGSFDKYFDLFINGQTDYGDFFDHLIPWYNHRNELNVHFLTYENLKENTREEVLKIAKFIGEEYYHSIMADPKYLENVLYYSSLDYMKRHTNEEFGSVFRSPVNLNALKHMPSGLKQFFEYRAKHFQVETLSDVEVVRKGAVGDWKNHFNQEQEEKMKQWIKEKTKGSDVMALWKGK